MEILLTNFVFSVSRVIFQCPTKVCLSWRWINSVLYWIQYCEVSEQYRTSTALCQIDGLVAIYWSNCYQNERLRNTDVPNEILVYYSNHNGTKKFIHIVSQSVLFERKHIYDVLVYVNFFAYICIQSQLKNKNSKSTNVFTWCHGH